ncbi:MAG: serine/threonine-protein kinase [Planctomycetota bacterium]
MGAEFTTDEWNRIESIFDAVADLEPAARQERLRELTADKPRLREHVESLLLYDAADSLPALSDPKPVANPAPVHQAGSEFHGYRLLYPLAISPASEVWCGESTDDQRPDVNRVAIKFLRDTTDERRLDRFRNEAMLLSQFRHPNIAEFLDCGRTDAGSPYIVTRFVVGKSLTEYADHHQLTATQRAELAMRVCEAVNYAHRYLVVHRDLKPSNILVTQDGRPVVLDFGISKVVSDEPELSGNGSLPALELTSTVERPMTPAYASPEQVRGEPVTTATDVHALGTILYELACGHHAFSQTAHPGFPKLFDRISSSLPKLPSEMVTESSLPLGVSPGEGVESAPVLLAALRGTTPRQLRRELRRGLDSIVMMALAKSPDDRYCSVSDLQSDLENFVARRPVRARVERDVLRASVRRQPLRWLAGTAIVMGTLAAVLTSFWWGQRLGDSQRELNDALAISQTERQRAESAMQNRTRANQTLGKVLGWQSDARSDDDANPIEFAEDASPAILAGVARRAAESRQFTSAFAALEQLSKADFAKEGLVQPTIDAAVAWQKLGRPTAGIQRLGDLIEPGTALARGLDKATLLDLKCIAMRLLMDAGRTDEANTWIDEQVDLGLPLWTELGARHALIVAESRMQVGWGNGCQEIIDELQSDPARFRMQPRDYAQLAYLKLKNQKLKPVESMDAKLRAAAASDPESHLWLLLLEEDAAKEFSSAEERRERLFSLGEVAESLDENHFGRLYSYAELAGVAEDESDSKTEQEWLERLWKIAEAIGELGTIQLAQSTVRLMDRSESSQQVLGYLEKLRPYRGTFRKYPYLERELVDHEFTAQFALGRFAKAEPLIEQLRLLEAELWGEKSYYYAYACAAVADTKERLGKSKDAEEATLTTTQSLRQVAKSGEFGYAVSFFAPIFSRQRNESSQPRHDWVERFIRHRDNEPATQLGMLAFHAEELLDKASSDARSVIQATLKQIESRSPLPDEQVIPALRICRLAAILGDFDRAKPLVDRHVESVDPARVDAAASCVILSTAAAGDLEKTYEIAKSWMNRLGDNNGHVRSSIWRIAESQSTKQAAERWNALLKK